MSDINIAEFINLPIVAACFLIGYMVKNYVKKIPNKYIPLIMIIIGILISVIISLTNSDKALVNSIISGAISGLASTGSYEFIVNTFGLKPTKEMTSDDTSETSEITEEEQ